MMATTTNGRWREVRRDNPCPACEKDHYCAWAPDGQLLRCMGSGTTPDGMRLVKTDANGGTLYTPIEHRHNGNGRAHPPAAPAPRSARATVNLAAMLESCRAKMTAERLAALADSTGLPATAWAKLDPGWCDAADLQTLYASGGGWAEQCPTGAYCFREYDGKARLVGLSLRAEDGRKGSPSGYIGARRGVVIPTDFHQHPGAKLAVEGASDVAACCAMGWAAVGRPSNRAGAAYLAELLDGGEVLVVGENDAKATGAWPGRDGAKAVAKQLAAQWREPVRWTLPRLARKTFGHG